MSVQQIPITRYIAITIKIFFIVSNIYYAYECMIPEKALSYVATYYTVIY